ncbi:hypothetical protein C8R47DRAFT_1067270 [Mycena vitilis]|nr:hypothetical protein C8R47DRAFT_1067270 [Mycena vitilis]
MTAVDTNSEASSGKFFPLRRSSPTSPSPQIRSCGPWVAGPLFSVVPSSPLLATTDTDDTWYAVTKGRYIGVTNVHALEQVAIMRISAAAHKAYSTQAAALRAFNLALEGNWVVIVPTVEVAPNWIPKIVFLYPWGTPLRQTAEWLMDRNHATLAEPGLLRGYVDCSPAGCSICLKPHVKHPAVPGFSFTILTTCPHHEDIDDFDFFLAPNRAVAALLPPERKHQTCRGNLWVVKHPLPSPAAGISNHTLPIVDVLPTDWAHIDELVRRWVVRMYEHAAASALFAFVGNGQHPTHRSVSNPSSAMAAAAARKAGLLAFAGGAILHLYSTLMAQDDGPVPVYDLDEIIANLDLEDEIPRRRRPVSRTHVTPTQPRPPRARSPSTPPPRYSAVPEVTRAVPLTPQIPAGSPTVYEVGSSPGPTYSTEWSEAASAVQASPTSHVRAVRKSKRRGGKPAAYVVFRGRDIGVMHNWPDVLAATSGVSFSLQQGYRTVPQAEAVFQWADTNGWTCCSSAWQPRPIAPSQAPKPLPLSAGPNPPASDSPLAFRHPDDRWYIVYQGINPGVFGTSVECALNVLGIRDAVHNSADSYLAAKNKFRGAMEKGDVHPTEILFP